MTSFKGAIKKIATATATVAVISGGLISAPAAIAGPLTYTCNSGFTYKASTGKCEKIQTETLPYAYTHAGSWTARYFPGDLPGSEPGQCPECSFGYNAVLPTEINAAGASRGYVALSTPYVTIKNWSDYYVRWDSVGTKDPAPSGWTDNGTGYERTVTTIQDPISVSEDTSSESAAIEAVFGARNGSEATALYNQALTAFNGLNLQSSKDALSGRLNDARVFQDQMVADDPVVAKIEAYLAAASSATTSAAAFAAIEQANAELGNVTVSKTRAALETRIQQETTRANQLKNDEDVSAQINTLIAEADAATVSVDIFAKVDAAEALLPSLFSQTIRSNLQLEIDLARARAVQAEAAEKEAAHQVKLTADIRNYLDTAAAASTSVDMYTHIALADGLVEGISDDDTREAFKREIISLTADADSLRAAEEASEALAQLVAEVEAKIALARAATNSIQGYEFLYEAAGSLQSINDVTERSRLTEELTAAYAVVDALRDAEIEANRQSRLEAEVRSYIASANAATKSGEAFYYVGLAESQLSKVTDATVASALTAELNIAAAHADQLKKAEDLARSQADLIALVTNELALAMNAATSAEGYSRLYSARTSLPGILDDAIRISLEDEAALVLARLNALRKAEEAQATQDAIIHLIELDLESSMKAVDSASAYAKAARAEDRIKDIADSAIADKLRESVEAAYKHADELKAAEDSARTQKDIANTIEAAVAAALAATTQAEAEALLRSARGSFASIEGSVERARLLAIIENAETIIRNRFSPAGGTSRVSEDTVKPLSPEEIRRVVEMADEIINTASVNDSNRQRLIETIAELNRIASLQGGRLDPALVNLIAIANQHLVSLLSEEEFRSVKGATVGIVGQVWQRARESKAAFARRAESSLRLNARRAQLVTVAAARSQAMPQRRATQRGLLAQVHKAGVETSWIVVVKPKRMPVVKMYGILPASS